MKKTNRICPPALLAVLIAIACSSGEESHTRRSTAENMSEAPPPRTYRVRGVVRQIPAAGEPGTPLLIHHESIPDFVDLTGEVRAMEAMTMAFPAAPEVSLSELAPGDKIVFELEVDWGADTPARITAVEKIPADTVLEF